VRATGHHLIPDAVAGLALHSAPEVRRA
jgi:hypothetical protein